MFDFPLPRIEYDPDSPTIKANSDKVMALAERKREQKEAYKLLPWYRLGLRHRTRKAIRSIEREMEKACAYQRFLLTQPQMVRMLDATLKHRAEMDVEV